MLNLFSDEECESILKNRTGAKFFSEKTPATLEVKAESKTENIQLNTEANSSENLSLPIIEVPPTEPKLS